MVMHNYILLYTMSCNKQYIIYIIFIIYTAHFLTKCHQKCAVADANAHALFCFDVRRIVQQN